MALNPLATVADLDARGIDTSDTTLADTLLESASAAVREAAGVPITETTATIKLATPHGRRLTLPPPVRTVASVTVDGDTVDDWALVGHSLWWSRGWQAPGEIPGVVTVTLTFGLSEVPADIVDLVCNLVGAGVRHSEEGYAARKTGLAGWAEAVDDYRRSEQYAQNADQTSTPMELPERTRRWLRKRFGGGATVVVTRS